MTSVKTSHRNYWSLPAEIREGILKVLLNDGISCAGFATVSREWQTVIERHNFERLKVTPSCLNDFHIMTYRNQHLVRYVWLCIEIGEYKTSATWGVIDADNRLVAEAVESLFSALSTWKSYGNLTLDISVYSPSDSRGALKYLTFEPDLIPNCSYDHDVEEVASRALTRGLTTTLAIQRVFDTILINYGYDCRRIDDEAYWLFNDAATDPDFTGDPSERLDCHELERECTKCEQSPLNEDGEFLHRCWEQLPSVPAVTHVLLRLQTRRTWPHEHLHKLFACLPRLQEIHYEPWRNWDEHEDLTHCDFEELLPPSSLDTLKKLVLFENFNEVYPELIECSRLQAPSSHVSAFLAQASLCLESLSASFLADASYFCYACHPSWTWPDLTSLTLTSQLLQPGADLQELEHMLRAAATVALQMPKLETLEIWNGRKELAALFRYQSQPARLTWKSTWEFSVPNSVTQAWNDVAMMHQSGRCVVVEEVLNAAMIKSHGDSIINLMLSQAVVRPVSLQQILREQRYLDP